MHNLKPNTSHSDPLFVSHSPGFHKTFRISSSIELTTENGKRKAEEQTSLGGEDL